MDFLTINGTAYPIRQGTGRELPRTFAGTERPRYDNSLGNTQHSGRRKFTAEMFFAPDTTALNTFLDVISVAGARGIPTAVSLAGEITRGDTLQVWVRLGEIRHVTTTLPDRTQRVYWVAPLTMEEPDYVVGTA